MSRLILVLVLLFMQPVLSLAEVTSFDVLDAGVSKEHMAADRNVSATYAQKSGQRPVADAYFLDAGDKIEIKVFGQEKLGYTARLDASGTINYPFLGEIRIIGKTVSQVERMITSGLKKGYLVSPHVNITIVEYRPFYIKGNVVRPGAYPYQPGLTLNKAVSLAGGYTEFGDAHGVMVLREKGSSHHEIRLHDGEVVYPGDTVTVPESSFYINGDVNKPGVYPFKQGRTILEAITIAGGYSEAASEHDIVVVRKGGREKHSMALNESALVSMGDAITVRSILFYIDGEVRNPGEYPYKLGITVREAISLAGGLTEIGSVNKLYMKNDSNQLVAIKLDDHLRRDESIIVKQSFF